MKSSKMDIKDVVENLQELLAWYMEENYDSETFYKREAVSEAIKSVKEVEDHHETFEWCSDCKEYDREHHCCHRWSKQIKKAIVDVKEYHDDMLKAIAKKLNEYNNFGSDCERCVAIRFCENMDVNQFLTCEDTVYKWMKEIEDEEVTSQK